MVQHFQRTGHRVAIAGSPGAIHTGSNQSAGCPGLGCVSLLLGTAQIGRAKVCPHPSDRTNTYLAKHGLWFRLSWPGVAAPG